MQHSSWMQLHLVFVLILSAKQNDSWWPRRSTGFIICNQDTRCILQVILWPTCSQVQSSGCWCKKTQSTISSPELRLKPLECSWHIWLDSSSLRLSSLQRLFSQRSVDSQADGSIRRRHRGQSCCSPPPSVLYFEAFQQHTRAGWRCVTHSADGGVCILYTKHLTFI